MYLYSVNRVDRLFGILTLLQSRKYVQAEQISERFEISIRTVYRDIRAIAEQGIPVSFEPRRGYFVTQGYFLPPVSFSSEEANALLLMKSMIAGFADRSIQKHYTSALNKVSAVLPEGQKERLQKLDDRTKMQLPKHINNDFEFLTTIQEGIAEQRLMTLQYRKGDGARSSRMIEPIGLIYYAFHWHLIAWCHKQSGYRDFRVSRIQQLRCLDKPFQKKDHLPLNEYMKMLPVDY